jgi:hypothetical protein
MEEYCIMFIVKPEEKKKKNKDGKKMAFQGQLVIEYASSPSSYAEVEEDALKVIDPIAKAIGGEATISGIVKSEGEVQ